MTDPKPQQSEPSMEEILASIRRIISEDDRPGGKRAEPPKEEAEPAAAPPVKEAAPARVEEEEVLELTDEVAPEPEPPPEPEPEPDASDVVIELKDRVAQEPEEPALALPPAPDEGLLSRPAAAAAAASFAQLAAQVARERDSVPLGIGMRTLEDLVKELMRPMIKEWLDAHLPGLVERLVAQEINRVSGRGQDAA